MASDILRLDSFLSAEQEQALKTYSQLATNLEFPSDPNANPALGLLPHIPDSFNDATTYAGAARYIDTGSTPEEYANAIQEVTFRTLKSNVTGRVIKQAMARQAGTALNIDIDKAEEIKLRGYDYISVYSALAVDGLLVACNMLRSPVRQLGEQQSAIDTAKDTYARTRKPIRAVIDEDSGTRLDELMDRAQDHVRQLQEKPIKFAGIEVSRHKSVTISRAIRFTLGAKLKGKSSSEIVDEVSDSILENLAPNTTEEERIFAVKYSGKLIQFMLGAASVNRELAQAPHLRAAAFLQNRLTGMDDRGERLTFDRDMKKFARASK